MKQEQTKKSFCLNFAGKKTDPYQRDDSDGAPSRLLPESHPSKENQPKVSCRKIHPLPETY